MRVIRRVLTVLIIVVAVALVLLFTPLGKAPLETVFPASAVQPVDLATFARSGKPNEYLACPPDFCAAEPDMPSPAFDLPVAELIARWQAVVAAQPRVTLRAEPAPMQFEYVQRSARFRFPDLVTVRFVPLSDTRSTLAVYSRSIYGLQDLGVNRKRVTDWLEKLGAPAP